MKKIATNDYWIKIEIKGKEIMRFDRDRILKILEN